MDCVLQNAQDKMQTEGKMQDCKFQTLKLLHHVTISIIEC